MWFGIAFLSALLHGFYDVSKKQSLKSNDVIPILFLNTLFSSLLFAPLLICSACGMIPADSKLYTALPTMPELGYIFSKSFLVLSSWFFGYLGMKHLPLSIVGPINATRPVMVLTGAVIVFGEVLNIYQWLGVIAAVIAFAMLGRSGSKEGIRFSHNRWIWATAAGCILGACSGLYDKFLMSPETGLGLNTASVQTFYNFGQCLLMGIMMLFMHIPHRAEKPLRWTWAIPCISIFIVLSDFAYLYALSMPGALVAVVSMVRRVSVIVSFCFAAFILHEKNIRSKAADLVLVAVSMGLLCLGTID